MDEAPRTAGHVVLTTGRDDGFASLRRPPSPDPSGTSWAARCGTGRPGRTSASGTRRRTGPTRWTSSSPHTRAPGVAHPGARRPDGGHPYAFLRGSANIMADDFARLPDTRHHPGHLRRRPPGQLRLPTRPRSGSWCSTSRLRRGAPRRLGVGPAAPGHQRVRGRPAERLPRVRVRRRGPHCVAEYREQIGYLAEQPLLARSFERLDVDRLRAAASRPSFRARSPCRPPRPPADQRPALRASPSSATARSCGWWRNRR